MFTLVFQLDAGWDVKPANLIESRFSSLTKKSVLEKHVCVDSKPSNRMAPDTDGEGTFKVNKGNHCSYII